MITYESNVPPCVKVILDDFNMALTSFNTLGYFLAEATSPPPDGYQGYNLIPEPSFSLIRRTIARQARRPFVRVLKRVWFDYERDAKGGLVPVPGQKHQYVRSSRAMKSADVVIPRRKYMSPIINPLMLVANLEARFHDQTHPVTCWRNTKDLYFRFHNDAGMEILDDMLEQMSTREEMRDALFHTTRKTKT